MNRKAEFVPYPKSKGKQQLLEATVDAQTVIMVTNPQVVETTNDLTVQLARVLEGYEFKTIVGALCSVLDTTLDYYLEHNVHIGNKVQSQDEEAGFDIPQTLKDRLDKVMDQHKDDDDLMAKVFVEVLKYAQEEEK